MSATDAGGGAAIQVFVRVRPNHVSPGTHTHTYDTEGAAACIRLDEASENRIVVPLMPERGILTEEAFNYDGILPGTAEQERVYAHVCEPLLQQVLRGVNATLIMYGQTGSGKTHTMIGGADGSTRGIVPRAAEAMFELLGDVCGSDALVAGGGSSGTRVPASVNVSMLEVYNEEIRDLLSAVSMASLDRESDAAPVEAAEDARRLSNSTVGTAASSVSQPRVPGVSRAVAARGAGARAPGTPRTSAGSRVSTSSGLSSTSSISVGAASVAHSSLRVVDGVAGVAGYRATGIHVEGAVSAPVACTSDVLRLLDFGLGVRVVSKTNCNAHSSRSHLIFVITVTTTNEDGESRTAKLTLVDLAGAYYQTGRASALPKHQRQLECFAGSEMVSKSGVTGMHLEEAKHINKSLTQLGMVINALTTGGSRHIPYRNSTLTRLLQDSLGGNSRTALILTVSPLADDVEQTKSTLRFGARAKLVQNRPVANVVRSSAATSAELALLHATIRRQRALLSALANAAADGGVDVTALAAAFSPETIKLLHAADETGVGTRNSDGRTADAVDVSAAHVAARIHAAVAGTSTPTGLSNMTMPSTPNTRTRPSYLAPTSASKSRADVVRATSAAKARASIAIADHDVGNSTRKRVVQRASGMHTHASLMSPPLAQRTRVHVSMVATPAGPHDLEGDHDKVGVDASVSPFAEAVSAEAATVTAAVEEAVAAESMDHAAAIAALFDEVQVLRADLAARDAQIHALNDTVALSTQDNLALAQELKVIRGAAADAELVASKNEAVSPWSTASLRSPVPMLRQPEDGSAELGGARAHLDTAGTPAQSNLRAMFDLSSPAPASLQLRPLPQELAFAEAAAAIAEAANARTRMEAMEFELRERAEHVAALQRDLEASAARVASLGAALAGAEAAQAQADAGHLAQLVELQQSSEVYTERIELLSVESGRIRDELARVCTDRDRLAALCSEHEVRSAIMDGLQQEFTALQEENELLRSRALALVENANQHESALKTNDEARRVLEHDKASILVELQALKASAARACEDAAAKDARLQTAEAALGHAEAELERRDCTLRDTVEQLSLANDERAMLAKETASLLQTIEEVRQHAATELAAAQSSLQALREELEIACTGRAAADALSAKLGVELEESRSAATRAMSLISDAEMALNQEQQRSAHLRHELAQAHESIEHFRRASAKLEAQVSELTSQLDSATQSATADSSRAAAAEQELASSMSERQVLSSQLTTLENEVAMARHGVQTAHQKRLALEQQSNLAQRELAAAEARVAALESELHESERKLEKTRAEAQSTMQQHTQMVERLRSALIDAEERALRAETELTSCRGELTDTIAGLAAAERSHADAAAGWAANLADMKSDAQAAALELAAENARASRLETALQAAHTDLDEARRISSAHADAAMVAADDLRVKLEESLAEVARLRSLLAEVESANQRLAGERDEASTRLLDALAADACNRSDAEARVAAMNEEHQRKRSALSDLVEDLQREMASLRNALTSSHEEYTAARMSSEATEAHLAEVVQQLAEVTARFHDVDTRLAAITNERDEAVRCARDADATITEQREALDAARASVQLLQSEAAREATRAHELEVQCAALEDCVRANAVEAEAAQDKLRAAVSQAEQHASNSHALCEREQECNHLRAEVALLQAQAVALQEQLLATRDAMQARIVEQEREVVRVRAEAESSIRLALEATSEAAQQQVRVAYVDAARRSNPFMAAAIAAQRYVLPQLHALLAETRAHVAALQTSTADLEATVTTQARELRQARAQLTEAGTAFASQADTAAATHRREIEEVRAALAVAEVTQRQQAADRMLLQQQLAAAEMHSEDLRSAMLKEALRQVEQFERADDVLVATSPVIAAPVSVPTSPMSPTPQFSQTTQVDDGEDGIPVASFKAFLGQSSPAQPLLTAGNAVRTPVALRTPARVAATPMIPRRFFDADMDVIVRKYVSAVEGQETLRAEAKRAAIDAYSRAERMLELRGGAVYVKLHHTQLQLEAAKQTMAAAAEALHSEKSRAEALAAEVNVLKGRDTAHRRTINQLEVSLFELSASNAAVVERLQRERDDERQQKEAAEAESRDLAARLALRVQQGTGFIVPSDETVVHSTPASRGRIRTDPSSDGPRASPGSALRSVDANARGVQAGTPTKPAASTPAPASAAKTFARMAAMRATGHRTSAMLDGADVENGVLPQARTPGAAGLGPSTLRGRTASPFIAATPLRNGDSTLGLRKAAARNVIAAGALTAAPLEPADVQILTIPGDDGTVTAVRMPR